MDLDLPAGAERGLCSSARPRTAERSFVILRPQELRRARTWISVSWAAWSSQSVSTSYDSRQHTPAVFKGLEEGFGGE